MTKRLFIGGALGVLLAASPQATAQISRDNEASGFTTTEPIEVAGVVLPPGGYLITVVNQQAGETYNRNVIQIADAATRKVLVTAGANPRPAKTDPASTLPLFEYYEAEGLSPRAMRTWYPAGTETARDILYPRKRAVALARVAHVSVPAIPDETREADLVSAPVTSIAPEPEARTAAPSPEPAATVAEARTALPETASRDPLLAGFGLLSLCGALALRALAR